MVLMDVPKPLVEEPNVVELGDEKFIVVEPYVARLVIDA